MLKGIDISQYQGIIDWNKVKADGIEFAIIRMGIGSDVKTQDDKRWYENCKGAESVDIPYGLYLYSYALTTEEAISEARHMIRCAKMVNPVLGCWFDMEDADSYKRKHGINVYHSREMLTDFCLTWLEIVAKEGFKVGTYASYDYFKNILDYDKLKKKGSIWYAHWGIEKPLMDCDIWQYSDKGKVNGITGRVDLNYANAVDTSHIYTDNKQAGKESEFYPQYTGETTATLIEAMKKLNIDSSFAHRTKIAVANNITNYIGSKEQNLKIYQLLKTGKLRKE